MVEDVQAVGGVFAACAGAGEHVLDLAAAFGEETVPGLDARLSGRRQGDDQAQHRQAVVIDQIDRAVTMTAAIVEGIGPDRLAAPTPCAKWDVRTELNHLVGGMRIFAAELTGTGAGGAHEDDWLGTDPQAAYATAAGLDRAAWRRPDVLEATVRLGFGAVPAPMAALIHLTEVLVHGADLAVATGQEALIDEPACEELLIVMRGMDFSAFRRPDMFGPEVPAPADAPAHRRLLAFLGRDVRPR